MDNYFPTMFHPVLGEADFKRISKFINEECGIRLPIEKRVMVEARLHKRLRVLHIKSFSEYLSMVFDSGTINPEVINMIDVITTNKTDFFREPAHFEFLSREVLPEYFRNNRSKQFKVWSAGCSSGEEVYTLAIVLNEFALENPGFSYSILGTDISTRMLQAAKTAIYTEDMSAPISNTLRVKYLLRNKDRKTATVRIVPELRDKVQFEHVNLINNNLKNYDPFDAIFCRNVLIYFDRETQLKVITKLSNQLRTGCYLFIGHSEAIMNTSLPLKQVGPSLYQKQ